MRLRLRFEDRLAPPAGAADADAAAAYCAIAWEHDGACYPSVDHVDFGAAMLGQWCVAARALLRGDTEAHLAFVEGGYAIDVVRADDGALVCTPAGVTPPARWHVTLIEFVESLLGAGEAIAEHLERAGWGADERAALGTDVERLREALAEMARRAGHEAPAARDDDDAETRD